MEIEKYAEVNSHGIEYVIQVRANDEEMRVQIEEKSTSTIWVNSFDRASLEERTHRAGNFKKYSVFLKMFLQAIAQQSQSVFIDILSPHELELLKSMQSNNTNRAAAAATQQQSQQAASSAMSQRRYIIMTYQVEYDTVKYPLPLELEENPDTATLKAIINRLRLENELLVGTKGRSNEVNQIPTMKSEIETLKAKLIKAQQQQIGVGGGASVASSSTGLLKQVEDLSREVKILRQAGEVKDREIAMLKAENSKLHDDSESFDDMREAVVRMKEGERVICSQQQRIEQMGLEIASVLEELERQRQSEKKYKNRIASLESELESTLEKVAASTTRGGVGASGKNSFSKVSQSPYRAGKQSSSSNLLNGSGKKKLMISTSPSRNNSMILNNNASGRNTPTRGLSRNNSQSSLKGSSTGFGSASKRRNSIDSETASSRAKKPAGSLLNLRSSSPLRSSSKDFQTMVSHSKTNTTGTRQTRDSYEDRSFTKNGSVKRKSGDDSTEMKGGRKVVVNSRVGGSLLVDRENSAQKKRDTSFERSDKSKDRINGTSFVKAKATATSTAKSTRAETRSYGKFGQNEDDQDEDEQRLQKKLDDLRSKNKPGFGGIQITNGSFARAGTTGASAMTPGNRNAAAATSAGISSAGIARGSTLRSGSNGGAMAGMSVKEQMAADHLLHTSSVSNAFGESTFTSESNNEMGDKISNLLDLLKQAKN